MIDTSSVVLEVVFLVVMMPRQKFQNVTKARMHKEGGCYDQLLPLVQV